MKNMSCTYMVMKFIDEGRVVSVDGGQGTQRVIYIVYTFQPSPRGFIIMRNIDVGMLQQGYNSQPSIDDHVWTQVDCNDLSKGCSLSPLIESINHHQQTESTQMNFQKPFLREQFIWNNKVARESSSWASCHTEEHVKRPSDQSNIEDQNKSKRILPYEFL